MAGRLAVITKTDDAGNRQYAFRLEGSSPTPAAWFAIYALPPGIAAGNLQIGGIGDRMRPATRGGIQE